MVERFISKWQSNGIGWRVDVEDSRIDGTKKCYLYAGSSTYNTKEMSRLIECLVDECHQLGIRLEDRAYIKSLVDDWGRQDEQA